MSKPISIDDLIPGINPDLAEFFEWMAVISLNPRDEFEISARAQVETILDLPDVFQDFKYLSPKEFIEELNNTRNINQCQHKDYIYNLKMLLARFTFERSIYEEAKRQSKKTAKR